MFKKYGKLIFLVILLLITTELTIYVNRKVDNKLDKERETNTVEQIREQLKNSTAEEEGLNPYRDYWVYEIGYFAEEYPKEEEKLFQSVDMEAWRNDLNQLKDLVSNEYIDDKTLMTKVSTTIQKHISINYIPDIFAVDIDSGYFRTILLLMKDDEMKEQQ